MIGCKSGIINGGDLATQSNDFATRLQYPISAASLVASSKDAIRGAITVHFLYNLDAYCHIRLPVEDPEARPTAVQGLHGMNRGYFVTDTALLR